VTISVHTGACFDKCAEQLEQANKEIESNHVEVARLNKSLESERNARVKAQNQLHRTSEQVKSLEKINSKLHIDVKREKSLNAGLQGSLATERKRMQIQDATLLGTRLELESLKASVNIEPEHKLTIASTLEVPLPAQPFVVVLVDGDAYNVS
jgi:phage-related tail protein